MQRVFALPGKLHGNGKVKFAWQRRANAYLATSGYGLRSQRSKIMSSPTCFFSVNHVVNIVDRDGKAVAEMPLPGGFAL